MNVLLVIVVLLYLSFERLLALNSMYSSTYPEKGLGSLGSINAVLFLVICGLLSYFVWRLMQRKRMRAWYLVWFIFIILILSLLYGMAVHSEIVGVLNNDKLGWWLKEFSLVSYIFSSSVILILLPVSLLKKTYCVFDGLAERPADAIHFANYFLFAASCLVAGLFIYYIKTLIFHIHGDYLFQGIILLIAVILPMVFALVGIIDVLHWLRGRHRRFYSSK